ncbi:hypothetical protein [Mycolicibacterium sp.]|uniref:hypothetical protein n=1 Tax=Mycolicibacterium sp. TaxID=2320850 RepID=UPI0037C9181D
MSNIVTIEGYRQRGKTHAALALAATDAQQGRTVVWVGRSHHANENAFRQLLDSYIHPDLMLKAWHTNGRQRIHVKAPAARGTHFCLVTGEPRGAILFGLGSSREHVDSNHTFVFDEAPIPYGFVRANPNAHIYVTVLPPGGDDL